EATERKRQVRARDEGGREGHEQAQREQHADAEEHRQRLVAAEARLHETQAEAAHFLGRLRHFLAQALEHAGDGLESRLFLALAAERQLFEPAIDCRRAVGHQCVRGGRDERGSKHEREKGHHQHGYTSILTTCLIQIYPIVCITTVAPSMMWPMRSRKSSCMCSGLMKHRATPRNAGRASRTYPVIRPCAV